jgi:hypothetical protein
MPASANGTWYWDEFRHVNTLHDVGDADRPTYVYVRLPRALQQPTNGCSCPYCREHPDDPPMWDTLAIPLYPKQHPDAYAFTVHAPDWTPAAHPTAEPPWVRRRQR